LRLAVNTLVVFTGQLETSQLTARNWQIVPPTPKSTPQKATTKRDFGEVGDAVVHMLAEAGSELRVIDVQAVEELLEA
jgi:hypothetical protein